MSISWLGGLAVAAMLAAGAVVAFGGDAAPTPKRLVLVELFTSEGCSSCPPADTLLKSLDERQTEVVALGFHVDYWDGLGWKDPFSSAEATARQREYGERMGLASIYTPQMIVGGRREFVGSNAGLANDAIAKAPAVAPIDVAVEIDAKSVAHVRLTLDPKLAGVVQVAVTEAGLSTDVRRGENGGRRLAHAPVVRTLVKADADPARAGAYAADVAMLAGWNRSNLRVVAFVQDGKSGAVSAVGRWVAAK